MTTIQENVQEYYGKELQSSNDLQTNACCDVVSPKKYIRAALTNVHDEVLSKYYGCGLTIPTTLDGLHVVDLGSGSGRDCYLLSQLVGPEGSVTGVDMTEAQLNVAQSHEEYHRLQFGFTKKNTEFLKGDIEKLLDLGLAEKSKDLIVSNCVINLAQDKRAVLQGAYALLKEGGELYFSDVYSDRRIPEDLTKDPVLYGECLSGALYWNDFLNLAKAVGFVDPRAVESKPITIENEDLQEKVGNIQFYSVTYRLFKLENLEPDCEDYGQAIRYRGTISAMPDTFQLDDHHFFEKGRIEKVCGNTYMMLHNTRLRTHFDFWGDLETHYGIFEGCGGAAPFNTNVADADGAQPMACC